MSTKASKKQATMPNKKLYATMPNKCTSWGEYSVPITTHRTF